MDVRDDCSAAAFDDLPHGETVFLEASELLLWLGASPRVDSLIIVRGRPSVHPVCLARPQLEPLSALEAQFQRM